jgi:hypothetical protein
VTFFTFERPNFEGDVMKAELNVITAYLVTAVAVVVGAAVL